MDNISLTLKRGILLRLIGNNEVAGKGTTLMKINFPGYLRETNGTIDLNTKAVGTLIGSSSSISQLDG